MEASISLLTLLPFQLDVLNVQAGQLAVGISVSSNLVVHIMCTSLGTRFAIQKEAVTYGLPLRIVIEMPLTGTSVAVDCHELGAKLFDWCFRSDYLHYGWSFYLIF